MADALSENPHSNKTRTLDFFSVCLGKTSVCLFSGVTIKSDSDAAGDGCSNAGRVNRQSA
jgi:hypothetical protein